MMLMRGGLIWLGRQARIKDPIQQRTLSQAFGHLERVLAVRFDADRKCSNPTQRQPGFEGAENAAVLDSPGPQRVDSAGGATPPPAHPLPLARCPLYGGLNGVGR